MKAKAKLTVFRRFQHLTKLLGMSSRLSWLKPCHGVPASPHGAPELSVREMTGSCESDKESCFLTGEDQDRENSRNSASTKLTT